MVYAGLLSALVLLDIWSLYAIIYQNMLSLAEVQADTVIYS